MMTSVCFIMLCVLISTSSTVTSSTKTLLPNPDFIINSANHQNGGTCSFTVRIVPSCSSVPSTREQISITFGDAYGNQVYATRTLNRCSADTFEVSGPCTYQICNIYLYRSGSDGWLQQRVEVYSYGTTSSSFIYSASIPANMWYGYNHCSRYAFARSSKATMK